MCVISLATRSHFSEASLPNLDRVCGNKVTHIGQKNHNISVYLRAALFIYLFGQRAKEVK